MIIHALQRLIGSGARCETLGGGQNTGSEMKDS